MNIQSERSLFLSLISAPLTPPSPPAKEATVPCEAFVSPRGQYYVVALGARIDVANASTARYYVRNGVSIGQAIRATISELSR
jgi:hypothetical protein